MADEQGRIWVGVHFGSRGFGHKTASGFLALAQGLPFGGRVAKDISFDLAPIYHKRGISFVHACATRIDLERRVVETDKGPQDYDYLLVATGRAGMGHEVRSSRAQGSAQRQPAVLAVALEEIEARCCDLRRGWKTAGGLST